ncbi:MucB/RseB C-terminal domain-containing protein [Simiduia agarivorans]|uniref:Sigma factor algU regulatory protein MucB n=1 Tax=Simiduia agarivorans (strain DSM 21679 / JCM 13881 / BCRC 17597 / SA1) TaxID=1117647 RepID=K4KG00_SIMAS|nr:MucB/RseB C-terminal domain-containing protein [Simiduia agarivorans]AFU97881.1 sigma factor algU regulatory protein MucB [Simiduia agarivorans SA1 = DSM 21679]
MRYLTLAGLIALLVVATSARSDANPPDARDLLRQFSKASSSHSYSGVLTYEFGAHLTSIAIEQQVTDQGRQERLLHLNGQLRGVSRQQAFCSTPSDRLLQGLEANVALEDYYHVSLIGQERVAGRAGYVVQVMPKDQYRYGYVITIDQSDYLALKILLVGPGNRVLERFQFVQINNLGSGETAGPIEDCPDTLMKVSWQAGWLPKGFRYVGAKTTEQREMLMFTDGMAAFSVFIESIESPAALEGKAQRGATVAYLGRLQSGSQSFRVTAVGEAPITTLERVALGMTRVY